MSVLNQVLRDLERRAPAAPELALAGAADAPAAPLASLAQKAFADPAPSVPASPAAAHRWRRIAIWTSVAGFTLSVLLALHLAEERNAQRRTPQPLGLATYGGVLSPTPPAAATPVAVGRAPSAPAAASPAATSASSTDTAHATGRAPAESADAAPRPVSAAVASETVAPARAGASAQRSVPAVAAPARAEPVAAASADAHDAAVRRSPASLADPQADIARAASLIARGRSTEAKELLHAVLARQPAHTDARAALAALQAESGDRSQALSTLLEGAVLEPLRFAAAAAQLQSELGDPQGALATLERVPPARRSGQHHALAGGIHLAAQQPAAAIAAYERALTSSDAQPVWWIGLGLAQEAIGARAAAHDALLRASRAPGLGEELRTFAARRLAALTPRDAASPAGDAPLAGLERH